MSHRLRDQVYIDHLREALWKHEVSYATVLVGAGLSLNAKPNSFGVNRMPTWPDLVARFVDDLYPESDPDLVRHRDAALRSSVASSGMLRLAEEYAIAFGRDRLDQRLKDLVPDLGFEPSDLHGALLRLPWRDVLTTNWDTLLERSSRRLTERHYEVVATPSDLSRSGHPRIVKLHGSFPHTRPFIVTEEDFRTYPDAFAPFVNLVRQAAMECVLCLIGFSGVDPNFLAWTGWVRDQLGSHQPHIFLVGLDSPPHAQRMLLERRGVRLIDLGSLAGLDDHPPGQRHGIALDWFLRNLAAGEADAKPEGWPGSGRPGPARPSIGNLPPVPPAPDPGFPGPAPDPLGKADLSWLVTATKVWRRGRDSYPGWLVAPAEVRARTWDQVKHAAHAAAPVLRDGGLIVRMFALRELIWQLQVCLMPLPETTYALVAETLAEAEEILKRSSHGPIVSARSIAQAVGTLRGHGATPEDVEAERELWTSDGDLGLVWLDLAFALLRRARELGDEAGFARWSTALEGSLREAPSTWPRLCYERCLHALGRLDRNRLAEVYGEWDGEDGGDPYNKVRAAGILVELGQITEAARLGADALERIRQSRRRDVDDLASLSREAWALYFLGAVRLALNAKSGGPVIASGIDEMHRLLRRLRSYVESPFATLATFDQALDRPVIHQDREIRPREAPHPASGETYEARAMRPGFWAQLRPALQALSLCDQTGMPAQISNVTVSRALRLKAVRHLKPVAPTTATVAILRIGRMEKQEEAAVFDAVWAARLTDGEARDLAARARSLLNVALACYRANRPIARESADYWQEKANFAARLLGRLATRLPLDDARRLVADVIGYYKRGEVDHRWIQESFTWLFEEAVKALPLEVRLEFLIDLAGVPSAEETFAFAWPMPLSDVQRASPASVRNVDVTALTPVLDGLFDFAAGASDPPGFQGAIMAPRDEAIVRLAILHGLGLVEGERKARLARLIWSRIAGGELPSNRLFIDDVLLILPEPHPGQAEKAFRRAYLSPGPHNPFELPGMLRDSRSFAEVGRRLKAVVGAATRRTPLQISPEEARTLGERLIRTMARIQTDAIPLSLFDAANLFHWAQIALAEAAVPNLETTQVTGRPCEAVLEFGRQGRDVLATRVACLRLDPDQLDGLADEIEQNLRSHRPDDVKTALRGVAHWVRARHRWRVPPPPVTLVKAVVMLVEDGWPEVAEEALGAAEALVRSRPQDLSEALEERLVRGLGRLAREADYDNGDLTDGEGVSADVIPAIRVAAVRLAVALSRSGMGDVEVIRHWIAAGTGDPLSMVREAFEAAMSDADPAPAGQVDPD